MKKILTVTAICGKLKFDEFADPYNPAVQQEQYDSYIESIHQQMKEAGRYEMKDVFDISKDIVQKP